MNWVDIVLIGTLAAGGLIGMWIGFKLHDRMPQATFRRAMLLVLVVAGLNLIRRGLFG